MDSNENTPSLFSEVQEYIDFNPESGDYVVTVSDIPSDLSAFLTTPSEV